MDMSRILATSDVVFKYLFGAKSSTELLRGFVNAVQRHAGMEEFSSLEIVNPIGERDYYSAKPTVIDIKAKSPDGTVINVEVQVRSQAEYGERSLYYWAKSYTEQILEGDKYHKLMPVVSVSLLNFNLFPDELPFHSTFQLMEKTKPEVCLTDDCVMHYLELRKLPQNEGSELAEWLYALRHLDEQEGPMMVLLKKNHNLQELADRYYRFENDSEARMIYEARMKEMRDQAAWLDEAQTKGLAAGKAEGLAAGKAEGLAQGMAEGIAQGITQGLTQGITQGIAEGEGRKARELALKLREKGMADSEILELTGIDLGS
jgi:predicted transposase/invertase (TIGR01784 family)